MAAFINQIAELLGTIENDLINAMLALTLLAFLMGCNQLLGAVMASTINTFNLNRLLKSITKSILICISTVIFCVVLDMFPLLLQRIGLLGNENIVQDIITVLQVLSILVIAIIKYAKEIYKKLLVLFDVTEP